MSSVPRTSLTLEQAAPGLARAVARFESTAYPGSIDLVTRELVRITSGRLSDCRICRNLRLAAAIDRGFDEDLVAQLDDPDGGDLPDAQRAAVRLAHAFLTDPDGLSEADRAEILSRLRPEQLADLLLDLVRYRPGSKLTVVSGTEPEDDTLIIR